MSEEKEFPAAGLGRGRMLEALEDEELLKLVVGLRLELQLIAHSGTPSYDDTFVMALADYVLKLPAGLVVSEFVPEPIRDGVREAVALASKIHGQMYWGGVVDDFDAFVEDLTHLLEAISEVFQEL